MEQADLTNVATGQPRRGKSRVHHLIAGHIDNIVEALGVLRALAAEPDEALLHEREPFLGEALDKAKEFAGAVFALKAAWPASASAVISVPATAVSVAISASGSAKVVPSASASASATCDEGDEPPTRFSVTFDPKAAERLERLAKDDQGKAEALGQALALEDLFRQIVAQGGRFLVQRSDGSIAEVVATRTGRGPRELDIPDRELELRNIDAQDISAQSESDEGTEERHRDALAKILDAAPIDEEPLDENEQAALAEVVMPEGLISIEEFRARRAC